MTKEEIDKWLDEEYGCSYTRLEELHDFYFEKYTDLREENKQLKEEKEELKKWLEDEKYILAKSVSHIYEDSLGHSKFVNEDIYNELIKVSDKIKELEEGVKWK